MSNLDHKPNLSFLQVASARLERRIADLADIADWRDELQSKLHRAQLIFELVDCTHTDELGALAAKVEVFKQVCDGLAGVTTLPLSERKAA
jgi:hypothetical protein